jgi:hypothetical protein
VNIYFFPPDPENIMNGTKPKNETTVQRLQKNKDANKKVARKRKLEAGKEYVSTAWKCVPPKVFVDTPCKCALKCNKTILKDKRERIFKDFCLLNWDLKSAFIMTHVEVIIKKRNYAKGPMSRCSYTRIYKLPSFDNAEESIVCKTMKKNNMVVGNS